MLLTAGTTCWRLSTARRASLLIDMADYYLAARAAMASARRSIHLLNWAFEPQTPFAPQPGGQAEGTDRFGDVLKRLADENPALDVRLLCWKSALPVAATMDFFPVRDRRFFAGSKSKFVLDGRLPLGAAHHQKMIVVDDSIAFCGGGDIAPDRWDTMAHLDDDPRRERTPGSGRFYDSRHEVMAVVEGAPAAILGDLFRDRWRHATGETLGAAEPPPEGPSPAWPAHLQADFRQTAVGVSRTWASWRGSPAIREVEALTYACIALARRSIYIENQYFTSPIVAEALAARLEERDGPDIVLVSPHQSPSYFDQLTMDRTRSRFLQRLREADRHGRLHCYSPVTTLGRNIIVHAKLTIIDDVLMRVGSANMNNRSMGFDTECDLTIEATEPEAGAARAAIAGLRDRLLAHWLGCESASVRRAIASHGGVGRAIEALRQTGHSRLRPIPPSRLGPAADFIAAFHIGDPVGPPDSWMPWRRRAQLRVESARMVERLRRAAQPGS